MSFLNMQTAMVSSVITDTVGTAILIILWLQNRKTLPGMLFWVVDFGFQTTAALLIILRGSIPDWLSAGFIAFLVIGGTLAGYWGLQSFLGKKNLQIYNFILLTIFLVVHGYFLFVQPNLDARDINISIGLLVFSSQCAWLLLRGTRYRLASSIRAVGWVFLASGLVSLLRIYSLLANPIAGNDFFKSGLDDTLLLLSYQILLVLVAFGLIMMVNQRLFDQVRIQEEKFKKAFHSAPYAVLITRFSDGLILDVNRGFEKITGYTLSETVGKNSLDLPLWVNEEDRKEVIAELSKRGEVQGKEFQFGSKSGKGLIGLYYAEILEMEHERVILSSISDITELKQTETHLEERNATLNAILESVSTPVFSVDRKYRYTSFNKSHSAVMKAIYGAEIEIGQSILGYESVPADRETAQINLDRALQGEQFIVSEYFGEPGDAYRYFEVALNPIHDPGGEIIGVSLFASDITDRKEVETQQQKFYNTLNASINELYTFDADTLHFEFVSSGALSNLGFTLDELRRMTPLDLKPDFTFASFQDLIAPLRRHEVKVIRFETHHQRADGSFYPVEVHLQLFDQSEQPLFLAVILDITERKKMGAELERTLEELKRSNGELEQFAYVASHDLQEPLRMVTSYLQLIERRYRGRLDKDADEFIGFAADGAQRMQRLINDLLAYSRVGTRGRSFVATSCEKALDQALNNLQLAIQENQATVTRDPLPEVLADETQLVQLFQNLIGNAIKFHGKEKPLVHISAEENEKEWVYSVRDHGIGIDPQYAERIFIIFQRVPNRKLYPGTGIGLAICKKIVQRHDGRIWVESRPGDGATFYFTLPKSGENGL